MKKIFALLIVSIMLLSLAGCVQTTSPTSATFPVITTKPPTTPVGFNVVKAMLPVSQRRMLPMRNYLHWVSGNSAFVFTLYQQLKKNSTGNLFYSPYSISTAIGMTYAEQPGTPKNR